MVYMKKCVVTTNSVERHVLEEEPNNELVHVDAPYEVNVVEGWQWNPNVMDHVG